MGVVSEPQVVEKAKSWWAFGWPQGLPVAQDEIYKRNTEAGMCVCWDLIIWPSATATSYWSQSLWNELRLLKILLNLHIEFDNEKAKSFYENR